MKVGVSLGSNLGESREILERAVDLLHGLSSDVLVSNWYQTSPVDCPPNSRDFINGAAEMEYEGDLFELLEKFQIFERGEGRKKKREINEPRPVDLDLLYAGDRVMSHERLVIPHPRMTERLFVMEPLLEICPDRILPGFDKTIEELTLTLRRYTKNQTCQKIA